MESKGTNTTTTQVEEKIKWERIACITLSGISVVAAIFCYKDLRKSLRLIGKATDHISQLTTIDVERNVIDQAINGAANREVGRTVSRAMRAVEDGIVEETQKRVHAAVQQSYGKIQKAITDAIAKEAANVNKDDIMREATERAKDLIVEKFDGKLDDLLSEYNRNLDNVGKIYQSIAKTMTENHGKDVVMKLT